MSDQEANKIFAENLKKFIEKRGLTQVAVADYLGVSEAAVSKWCKGETSPRMSKFDKLCELFGCSRTALMAEDGADILEAEDTKKTFQRLYDEHRVLFSALDSATPEELAKVEEYIKFLKAQR
jgi:transcriptional regulator with XRE-family HTH domain